MFWLRNVRLKKETSSRCPKNWLNFSPEQNYRSLRYIAIDYWLAFSGSKVIFLLHMIIYYIYLILVSFIRFWTLHNTSLNGSGRYILGVWDRELKDKNSQEQFADNYDITLLSNLTAFLSLKFLQLLASNIPVIWIKLVKRPMKDNWLRSNV